MCSEDGRVNLMAAGRRSAGLMFALVFALICATLTCLRNRPSPAAAFPLLYTIQKVIASLLVDSCYGFSRPYQRNWFFLVYGCVVGSVLNEF